MQSSKLNIANLLNSDRGDDDDEMDDITTESGFRRPEEFEDGRWSLYRPSKQLDANSVHTVTTSIGSSLYDDPDKHSIAFSDLTHDVNARVRRLHLGDYPPRDPARWSIGDPMGSPPPPGIPPSDRIPQHPSSQQSSFPRFPSHFEQLPSSSPDFRLSPQRDSTLKPIKPDPSIMHSDITTASQAGSKFYPAESPISANFSLPSFGSRQESRSSFSATTGPPNTLLPPAPLTPLQPASSPFAGGSDRLPRDSTAQTEARSPIQRSGDDSLPPRFPSHMDAGSPDHDSTPSPLSEYPPTLGSGEGVNYRHPSQGQMTPQMLKAKRKRANAEQLKVLNQVFQTTFFPSTELRIQLGKQLGMSPRTVQIWFQNRRQAWRTKSKHDKQEVGPKPSEVPNDSSWERLHSMHRRRPSLESMNSISAMSARSAPAGTHHLMPDPYSNQLASSSASTYALNLSERSAHPIASTTATASIPPSSVNVAASGFSLPPISAIAPASDSHAYPPHSPPGYPTSRGSLPSTPSPYEPRFPADVLSHSSLSHPTQPHDPSWGNGGRTEEPPHRLSLTERSRELPTAFSPSFPPSHGLMRGAGGGVR
ncbi:uncharacterized protein VTP21DRAFT_3040 [Calcarisporiella thermophila]|uniref:uncharacterized protein n=1 Tax=Calcarisporiella thermophila TaxID=911321 RepID=UPI0037431640